MVTEVPATATGAFNICTQLGAAPLDFIHAALGGFAGGFDFFTPSHGFHRGIHAGLVVGGNEREK
jgi:hypothetical protein